jgi:hypothetical protein
MEMFFTRHARARMLERQVSKFDILYALNSYHMSVMRDDQSTMLVADLPNGRTLKVWVSGGLPLESTAIIITVAWKE